MLSVVLEAGREYGPAEQYGTGRLHLAAFCPFKPLVEGSSPCPAEDGYAPLNPWEWNEHLQPQLVLLSITAADVRGMQSVETMSVLESYNLLRTNRNVWIELTNDGSQMWVEVEN